MTRRPLPTHRHVYVIGPHVGLQKVGIATDPKARLATLQTACPFDLFIHLAAPVLFEQAPAIERRAHRLLARSCVRNEWFETTPAEAMDAVRAAMAHRVPGGQSLPSEWRAKRQSAPPPVEQLLAAGRRVRPEAAFHQAPEPTSLPLFEFAQQTAADQQEQALVERVVGVLLKRMGSG